MKRTAEQVEWTWSDGWLLMALWGSQGTKGARPAELIANADMINHAIPTEDELSSALTKFVRCGLISVANGRYRLYPRYVIALRKAYEARGGLFSTGDKGLKWLKRAGLAPKNHKTVKVSRAQKKVAYDEYVKLFERARPRHL